MNRIEVFGFKNNSYVHFDITNMYRNMYSAYRNDILIDYGIRLKKHFDIVIIHNEYTSTIIKITDENNVIKIGGVSNAQR